MLKVLISCTVAIVILVGCSISQPYDNNEYELLAELEVRTLMMRRSCDNERMVIDAIPDLKYNVLLLSTYTYYIPKNTETFHISEILKNDISELETQYANKTATTMYCMFKTALILRKVRRALDAVGSKYRS